LICTLLKYKGVFNTMKKSITKTVVIVIIITMLAKLMALLNQQMIVTHFGISTQIDTYFFAVNFQVYAINCIGTTLITVIIPMFVGFMQTGENNRAFKFANNVISISVLLTVLIALIGIIFSPLIVKHLGYKDSIEDFKFTVMALRIMFPVLVFYALTFILQGILQSFERFFVPAFVSIISNLITITYIILFGNKLGIQGLLYATLVGLSAQAIIQIPSICKTKYRFSPSFGFRNKDIISALKITPPILISSSAYQINMLFNIGMATYFNAVTVINVGQQLVLVAILSLAASINSVMFPRLSSLVVSCNILEFKQSVLKMLKTMVFILLPMTLGLMALSQETINFIYGYGKFTAENTLLSAKILTLYSIGGVGLGVKEVIDKAFYSLKDTFDPAVIGVIIMLINISLSLVFIKFLGIGIFAIPLAYSIAATLGSLLGIYVLWKKIGSFGIKDFLKSFIKVSVSSSIMLVIVIILKIFLRCFNVHFVQTKVINLVIENAVKLLTPVIVGTLVFFMCSWLLKVDETIEIYTKLKTKLFRNNKL